MSLIDNNWIVCRNHGNGGLGKRKFDLCKYGLIFFSPSFPSTILTISRGI